jgi:integration host factor subunit alpha
LITPETTPPSIPTNSPTAPKTVTRADLCQAVYQKVGLSRTKSATLVELVLKEITDCLGAWRKTKVVPEAEGEGEARQTAAAVPSPAWRSQQACTVKLSSFGLFVVRKKGQRMGRNPKTSITVVIFV